MQGNGIIMRGIEVVRETQKDQCAKCYLQRSNAIRRKRNFAKNNNVSIVRRKNNNVQKIKLCNLSNLDKRMLQFEINDCSSIDRFKNKSKEKSACLKRLNVKAKNELNDNKNSSTTNLKHQKDVSQLWFLRWRNRKIHPTMMDKRIQQVDNGFFERFGSLFRDYSEVVQAQEAEEKSRVAEAAAEAKKEEPEENVTSETSEGDTADTSSDSESEGDKTDFISVALNIDELYCELLYEIIHNVGCDVSCEIGQTALFSYLQDAFKMSTNRHQELYEMAEKKEAPEILLNVEIIEAKDLVPKDSNGLSDPFVTLYLASNASHRYNTSVKTGTLNPSWEEHFALPVSDNTNEDTLCLEVWDFDPAETVREKFGKFLDVKGVKGIRKLVKEIAVTAATGQHENELIGRARVPLKGIPASGMTMWYSLDKKNKINRRGVVKIRLTFSSEKNSQVAGQEHRHLLRILLLHELEMSKVAPYWWCGQFSCQAEALLTQHIAQSGLSVTEVALAEWIVYTEIHKNHALNFQLFSHLLDKLIKPLQTSNFCDEDIKLFWESVKKLLPSCFSVVRKIRKKCSNEKNALKQLSEVLKIINKISMLEPPENIDLFPAKQYGWLTYNEDGPNCDIRATLNDAVVQGATDWFNHIMENNARQDDTDDGKLQYLTKIIQLVRTDIHKAIEFYDKLFQGVVNFQYVKTLYTLYQVKIATLSEPDIVTICKSLKRLTFSGNNVSETDAAEPLAVGTTLFELYLALQRFVILGQGLCPMDYNSFHIKNFHKWFHGGVAQWLDIAVFKALQRIEKAVELDSLLPVDNTVKYSSSAVDTLTIFYQIKIFWQQLNWPDIEGCYTFIAKIIDDICRCCVFFADKMALRVDGMGVKKDIYESKFEVTNEWCLAINNIDYVRQSLKPFTEELGMEDILQKLSDTKSHMEADRCRQTLENVIANAIDTVKNKIIELLEIVATKMAPGMKRLLIEGAELLNQDCNSVDRLMMYVDTNLATLHEQLNEDNFNRILDIIWDTLNNILEEILQSNLDKRRPPSFFANLYETLNLMVKSFKADGTSCDALLRTEHLLKINGLETSDLIFQVHLDLWKKQASIQGSSYGELSVRLQFINTELKIEVMNARNLFAMDSNGLCDSFVRIHLFPEEKFTSVVKPKTQTHNKTLFPLYDEVFTINLSPEQRKLQDALVMFSVKDKDFLGYNNQYVGEAYVHFKDIPDTSEPLSSLPQIHLKLLRPSDLDTDAIKSLEHRQGDKQAKEFLRKFKQRMGSAPAN